MARRLPDLPTLKRSFRSRKVSAVQTSMLPMHPASALQETADAFQCGQLHIAFPCCPGHGELPLATLELANALEGFAQARAAGLEGGTHHKLLLCSETTCSLEVHNHTRQVWSLTSPCFDRENRHSGCHDDQRNDHSHLCQRPNINVPWAVSHYQIATANGIP